MKAVVVYESMYGNTHLVADAIATGLRDRDVTVEVVAVDDAVAELLAGADLTVVGGPTHVHGMSRESTRKAAVDAAQKPGSDLTVDPDAERSGLRERFNRREVRRAKAPERGVRLAGPFARQGASHLEHRPRGDPPGHLVSLWRSSRWGKRFAVEATVKRSQAAGKTDKQAERHQGEQGEDGWARVRGSGDGEALVRQSACRFDVG